MGSNKRSRDSVPGMASINSIANVYMDAWQSYIDTVNDVWGDVTAPDAKLGAWASGFSKLLQAWTNGASDICGAYTTQHRSCTDDRVVTFVVGPEAECTDPRSLSLPSNLEVTGIEWTDLREVGGGGIQIDKRFLRVARDSGGRTISMSLVDLKSRADLYRPGMYVAMVYETGPQHRSLAIVVVTFT
jgi:hypothetical protein